MNAPDESSPERWHRFFGASANNVAWTLAESPAGELDANALLDAAHAAAWHWAEVGTELNRMRSRSLLALAHARAGLGKTALAYSDETRPYLLARAGAADWEIAMAHAIHAYAASAAGADDVHARAYADALRAFEAVTRSEDRDVVDSVLRHVPAPRAKS